MLRRLRIATIVTISTLLVLAALCVGLFRLAVELLPGYKAEIVAGVEQAVGRPIALDHIDLRWRGLGPEVVVNRLRLLNSDGSDSALEIGQASARFKLSDLWQREVALRPASISIEGLTLSLVRERDGRLRVQNLDGSGGSFDSQQLLEWLFQKGRVEMSDVRVDWLDMQRPPGPGERPQFLIDTASLAGNGEKQRLQAVIKLPAQLGKQLDIDVIATGAPSSWSANFTMNVANLQIAAFPQQWLRSGGQVVNGRLDAEFQGVVNNGRVEEMSGGWLVQGAEWQSADASPLKSWPELKGNSVWLDDGVAWRLSLNDLENDGEDFGSVQLELNREAVPQQLYFSADELPIRELAAAAVILPSIDDRVIEWLNAAKPEGTGYDLSAQLSLQEGAIVGGSGRVQLRDLMWQAAKPVPGISGVSGSLRWDGSEATLSIGSREAESSVVLDAPWVFREPLVATEARSEVTLRTDDATLAVTLGDIVLRNDDMAIRGEGRVQVIPNQPTNLWLNLGIDYADITAVKHYLPVGAMQRRPQVVRWLDNAFKDGEVTSGTASFDGPLTPKAITSGVGNFKVDLNLANARIQFQPKWPLVENINASVRFRDASITVDANRASLLNLDIQQFQASIPDLNKASVSLSGNFDSSVDEALEFLRETPLKKRFGKILAGFNTGGRAVGRIEQFDLPLKPPYVPTLSGYLDIKGGSLRGPGWRESIDKISGRLSFTDKTLRGSKLRGEVLGLTASGNLATKGKGIVLDLSGRIQDAWLYQRLGLPSDLIEGQLRWTGEVELGNGPVRWAVESDTKGMALKLPQPLGKERGQQRRLTLRSDQLTNKQLVIRVGYEQWLNGHLRWLNLNKNWLFDAAAVRLGGQPASLSAGMSGVHIDGSLATVDAEPWIAKLSSGSRSGAGSSTGGFELKEVNLYFNQLSYAGVRLPQQNIRWQPAGDGWLLALRGADVNGNVRWFNERLLAVDLKNLRLIPSEAKPAQASSTLQSPPNSMPSIQFSCDDCWYGDLSLGAINFNARPSDEGISVSELSVKSVALNVTGSASWDSSAYGPRTVLRTTASSKALPALLAQFGIADALDAENASLRSNFSWPGGPGDFSLARLSGDASMALDDGRIYKVEPGAAKAIGLLSLDMLPRRLAMNFDDVVKPGFAFDSISGDFVLDDGNAVTNNLLIDGPSARVQVSGRTGLGARDYDQKIQVNPKIGTGFTIAGALLGGSGVGAALLVGQELLNRPLDAITGLKYNVTGSWDNPQISSPKIAPGDVKTGPRGRRN